MGMLHKDEKVYEELKGRWDIHGADVLVMCLGDINGTWIDILMDLMGFMNVMVQRNFEG